MENRHILAGLGIGLLAILVVLFLFQGSFQDSNIPMNLDLNRKQSASTPVIKELQIQDLKEGSGSAKIESEDTITVNYIGTLLDGRKFDSSYDRKEPFSLQIGVGQVIKGWDLGLLGMKIGGKRRLFIPSDLAYGANGRGPIPPNSPLIFEVELLDLKKPEEPTPPPQPALNPEISQNPMLSPMSDNPSESPTPSVNPSPTSMP